MISNRKHLLVLQLRYDELSPFDQCLFTFEETLIRWEHLLFHILCKISHLPQLILHEILKWKYLFSPFPTCVNSRSVYQYIRHIRSRYRIDPRKNNRKIIFLGEKSFIIDEKQTEKWSWLSLKNRIPVKKTEKSHVWSEVSWVVFA